MKKSSDLCALSIKENINMKDIVALVVYHRVYDSRFICI